MKNLKIPTVLTFAFLVVTTLISGPTAVRAEDLGEKLVRQVWDRLKSGDPAEFEKVFAPGFQSAMIGGVHNRNRELQILGGVKLEEYRMRDFKTTRNGNVLVVTYYAAPKSKGSSFWFSHAKPGTPRMSVFIKTDKGWQMVAHANFMPLH
jgi:hypothetical protein